jgi:hypothetical protein
MVDTFPRVLGWRAGLAAYYSEVGRNQSAVEQVDWLVRAGALRGPKRIDWYATTGCLALVAHGLRDSALASTLYKELRPHAEQFAVVGYCSYVWGSTHGLLGLLACVLEDWNESAAHFEAAIRANERAGALPRLARSYIDYGEMLLRCGSHSRRGEELVGSGRQLAQQLGMARLASGASSAWRRS